MLENVLLHVYFFNLIVLLLEIIYSLYLFFLSSYQKSSILKANTLKHY